MAESGKMSLVHRRDQLSIQKYTRQHRLPESVSTQITQDDSHTDNCIDSQHLKSFRIHTREFDYSFYVIIPATPSYEPPWKLP